MLESAILVISPFAVSLKPFPEDVARVLSKRCASDGFFCHALLKFCSRSDLYHLLLRLDFSVSDLELSDESFRAGWLRGVVNRWLFLESMDAPKLSPMKEALGSTSLTEELSYLSMIFWSRNCRVFLSGIVARFFWIP